MNFREVAEEIYRRGHFSEVSFKRLSAHLSGSFLSLNNELRTLLYAGILLFSSGLGVAIYKNIDSIGHMAVIAVIAAASAACFLYCYKKHVPYANDKVSSPNVFFDYILLLGCLTFLSLPGYLQYQYSIFGDHPGLVFLFPALLFFVIAYLADHIGVLSMAITCIASYLGITITPTELLKANDFSSSHLIYAGLFLGASLVLAATWLSDRNVKKHFSFTYYNFSLHLLFVACLAGLFTFDFFYPFLLVLAVLVFASKYHADREHSFYFLVMAAIYGYIGITYFIFYLLYKSDLDLVAVYMGLFYLIGSSVYVIRLLKNYRKRYVHDGIS